MKEPKEVAKELIEKFYVCMPFKDVKLTSCSENPDLIINMERLSAKQCALICVDEIDSHIQASTPKNDPYANLFALEYWQEVKKEIEGL